MRSPNSVAVLTERGVHEMVAVCLCTSTFSASCRFAGRLLRRGLAAEVLQHLPLDPGQLV